MRAINHGKLTKPHPILFTGVPHGYKTCIVAGQGDCFFRSVDVLELNDHHATTPKALPSAFQSYEGWSQTDGLKKFTRSIYLSQRAKQDLVGEFILSDKQLCCVSVQYVRGGCVFYVLCHPV